MSPGDAFLQRFLTDHRAWSERIRRASYAESVSMDRVPEGVRVQVKWKNNKGEGSYEKIFTLQDLLGHTRTLSPPAWALQKKHCTCAQETIAGVLSKRGV